MSTLLEKAEAMRKVGASDRAEQALSKLIQMHLQKYEQHLHAVRRELEPFEKKFGMLSEEGYQRFNAGELGDDAEIMEWMGLCEDAQLYQERIDTLKAALKT